MLNLQKIFVCLLLTCLLIKLNYADTKLNIPKFSIGKNLNLTWQDLESMTSPNMTGVIIEISDRNDSVTKPTNQSKTTTSTSKSSTTTTSTTPSTTISIKESMRRKLTDFMSKPRHPKEMDTIIKEIIESFNVSSLNKGRPDNQTKSILNRLITALYALKKNQSSLNTRQFIDDVILNPNEVLPDGLFEGDILLTEEQAFNIFEVIEKRKLIRDPNSRWPMPIQFYFDGSHSASERDSIRSALKRWEEDTCIKFEEIFSPGRKNYLKFIKGGGCYSSVGYHPSASYQDISLGDGCLNKGTILHEVGHALGFFHEQSRPDRDSHVTILPQNMQVNKELNFQKYPESMIDTMGVPYDLASIMHYGAYYFSANNQFTIATKDPTYQQTIGQRIDLSFNDIKTANLAYCKASCSTTLNCQRNGYPHPKRCSTCLCPEPFTGNLCEIVSTAQTCGGTITQSGTISSPNYPSPYPGNTKCNWLIKAPVGTRIRITFHPDFRVNCDIYTPKGTCDRDWVEVRSKGSFDLGGPRFCCSTPPSSPIESESNEMLILFNSQNSNYNSIGFKVTIEFLPGSGVSTNAPTGTTIFNHCAAQPCLNNGLCENTKNGFRCICLKGYTGLRCETEEVICRTLTCENNGICVESIGGCVCLNGFSGPTCNVSSLTTKDTSSSLSPSPAPIVINPCDAKPCYNSGVCLSSADNYTCVCLKGFTGRNCEIEENTVCEKIKCLNNGVCVESFKGCVCPFGFTGPTCNGTIDQCQSSPCINGICLTTSSGYKCICMEGFSGEKCELSTKKYCTIEGICLNNGTCVESPSFEGFVCKCTSNFTGIFCETKIEMHPCDKNICGEYGVCQKQNASDYSCDCIPGYTGKQCETRINVCASEPCKNNGICKELDIPNSFTCYCPLGYMGRLCESKYMIERNPCSSSPCLNNGLCIPAINNQNYTCSCPFGFRGQNCELIENHCASNPCKSNEMCVNIANGFSCLCRPGYSCNIETTSTTKKTLITTHISSSTVDKCIVNVCLNGGTCFKLYENSIASMRCNCPSSYTGVFCEINMLVQNSMPLSRKMIIPRLCSDKPETETTNDKLRISNTPFSSDSYYLIQGDLIWFINGNELNTANWPKHLNHIFPLVPSSPDAIVYDSLYGNYYIFKLRSFWKFKANLFDPKEPSELLKGYPRFIEEQFGLATLDGGAFIESDKSQNELYLLKENKLLKFDNQMATNLLPLPIKSDLIQSIIPNDLNSFYILSNDKLYDFSLISNGTGFMLKSIDQDFKNWFICQPFLKTQSNLEELASIKRRICRDLSSINSILKLNKTSALMLIDQTFYNANITPRGYQLTGRNEVPYRLQSLTKIDDIKIVSTFLYNKNIFVFQSKYVWIYSTSTNRLVSNTPELFQNLFPNHNHINSIVGAHYSITTQRFYFFSEYFYIEYQNENNFSLRVSLQNLSTKLINVISSHNEDTSVYLIDKNGFVYYLNLLTDKMEEVNRDTASVELLSDCD